MKNPVHKRVIQIRETMPELTDFEFCVKANISSGTYQNIRTDKDVRKTTFYTIIKALSINPEWLMDGKKDAPMFIDNQAQTSSEPLMWKQESYTKLEMVNNYLQSRLDEAMATLNKAQDTISALVNMIPKRDDLGKAPANIFPRDISRMLAQTAGNS